MIDLAADGWLREAVRFRPLSGAIRYLVQVRREPCTHCPRGTRTVSIWVTARGRAEQVAWCHLCFNAVCEPVPLEDEHRTRYAIVRAAVSEGRVSPPWQAARPALDDLERRGLL
ncbi:MAG TPA: hypothetical protein VK689_21750 [Armatimonadota bacterium]|nr:hypothetical protein [Armatimonadota bacterium]